MFWISFDGQDESALVRRELPVDFGEKGVYSSYTQLGGMIGARLRSLHTSPLPRCVQTADALNFGSDANLRIVHDRLLGDPGVFVVDDQRAQLNWDKLGHEGIMQHLVASDEALPGMARPGPAARFLVHHMLTVAGDAAGLHLFVTHDSLVTTTAARLLGQQLGTDAWPWYLEGAFFWQDQDDLHIQYRDQYLMRQIRVLLH